MKLAGIHIPGLNAGARILDLGCGSGWGIKQAVDQGAVGFGMDISAAQLAASLHVLKDAVSKKAFFLQGAVSDFPFKPAAVDAVICSETIEHIPNPENLLQEIYKVLQPQKFAILSFPVKRTENAIKFFCKHFLTYSGHIQQFSLEEMMELLNNCGFKCILVSRQYFEWSFYYFWMAVFQQIPKIDRRGNQYGISAGQAKVEYMYKRLWAKLIQWKIGIFFLSVGNYLFPKSYTLLIQKQ